LDVRLRDAFIKRRPTQSSIQSVDNEICMITNRAV